LEGLDVQALGRLGRLVAAEQKAEYLDYLGRLEYRLVAAMVGFDARL